MCVPVSRWQCCLIIWAEFPIQQHKSLPFYSNKEHTGLHEIILLNTTFPFIKITEHDRRDEQTEQCWFTAKTDSVWSAAQSDLLSHAGRWKHISWWMFSPARGWEMICCSRPPEDDDDEYSVNLFTLSFFSPLNPCKTSVSCVLWCLSNISTFMYIFLFMAKSPWTPLRQYVIVESNF